MYIFYGPHGTGKTSCAKLLALALNCLSIETNRPCWTCSSCLDQISGKLSPIKEVISEATCISSLMKDESESSYFLYRVFIVETCSLFSTKIWNALLKGIKMANKKTVFIFNTVKLKDVPHPIATQCQKFRFTNISERDIIFKLQLIATQENLYVDSEALELIAFASSGSLYDAELLLERSCLLDGAVTVPMVQNLVGLVSDSKLMELLDFAFSAECGRTIQYVKSVFDSGVEPVDLLLQLASLMTRILAGCYHVPRQEQRTTSFMTENKTQRLRRALRILSKAEKQVQVSSSGRTWLIAALLQFVPDQSHAALCCSGTSLTHGHKRKCMDDEFNLKEPSKVLNPLEKSRSTNGDLDLEGSSPKEASKVLNTSENLNCTNGDMLAATEVEKLSLKEVTNFGTSNLAFQNLPNMSLSKHEIPAIEHRSHNQIFKKQKSIEKVDLQQVWHRVLDEINSTNLKAFLQTEGKLVALSTHEDLMEALLEFHCLQHLSRAQRSKASILHAFHATLGYHVKVKVQLVSFIDEPQRSGFKVDAENHVPSQVTSGNNGCGHEMHEKKKVFEPRGNRHAFVLKATPTDAICESQKHIQVTGISNLENNLSVDSSIEKEDDIKEQNLGLQFDIINTTPVEDFFHIENEMGKTSARTAANLQEENLEKDSIVKENNCWRATHHLGRAVEDFATCPDHSRCFWNFLCCARIPMSPGAL